MIRYPHCDPNVLHAPGECKYCDKHFVLQANRKLRKINFTGHHDPLKETCPSELQRDLETINKWGGNVPVPEGYEIGPLWSTTLVPEPKKPWWKRLFRG